MNHMATVILLHSALGLTSQVRDWAESLETEGHTVHTPDLFAGRTFTDVDSAVDFADGEGGAAAFVPAALTALNQVRGPVVLAGFSLGAAVAQLVAMKEERVRALVLMHSVLAPAWLEVDSWPERLSAQAHFSEGDEWVEADEVAALVEFAGDALEVFTYPGDGHLFAFDGWHEYDEDSSHRMYERVSDFLGSLD